jgi:CheY-like chemotaxis protein
MPVSANILLAEDEPNDAFFVRWAFEKAGLPHHISHVYDGQEALDYLSGTAPFGDRHKYPTPDLLLLDLKMPRLNGFDVLTWLRAHPKLRKLPVVVFSSSDHEQDIEQARHLGADEYRMKPSDIERFVELAKDLDAKWLNPQRGVSTPSRSVKPNGVGRVA